jgi:hypothetical protein
MGLKRHFVCTKAALSWNHSGIVSASKQLYQQVSKYISAEQASSDRCTHGMTASDTGALRELRRQACATIAVAKPNSENYPKYSRFVRFTPPSRPYDNLVCPGPCGYYKLKKR